MARGMKNAGMVAGDADAAEAQLRGPARHVPELRRQPPPRVGYELLERHDLRRLARDRREIAGPDWMISAFVELRSMACVSI